VGFGSTGQGRFVHPLDPRTLTPQEAARVQTFPDWFDFSCLARGQLQKAIGNAVPPMMAAAVLRELLVGELQ
jgi:DNA (cytosine-5)-methyltransferase 1